MDSVIDVPPYSHDPHLKLQIGKYVVTSIGLIIQKTNEIRPPENTEVKSPAKGFSVKNFFNRGMNK